MKITAKVVVEKEDDGRFIADATEYPGVMAYGSTVEKAIENVWTLLIKVLSDKRDNDDDPPAILV